MVRASARKMHLKKARAAEVTVFYRDDLFDFKSNLTDAQQKGKPDKVNRISMTKIATLFQLPPTTLYSDNPFGPHKVGRRPHLSDDAMATLTEEIERDDYCQRSKTPYEVGVAVDAKRNTKMAGKLISPPPLPE